MALMYRLGSSPGNGMIFLIIMGDLEVEKEVFMTGGSACLLLLGGRATLDPAP